MRLDALTWEESWESTKWRHGHLETLRTPSMLTEKMQKEWYDTVVCSRTSPHRYWALKETGKEIKEKSSLTWSEEYLVGVGGLTYISWENRSAEISLIIADKFHRMKLGEKAVDLLLTQAFNMMNLEVVYGEVYKCNPTGVKFWDKMILKYDAVRVVKPFVKWYAGQYWDSV